MKKKEHYLFCEFMSWRGTGVLRVKEKRMRQTRDIPQGYHHHFHCRIFFSFFFPSLLSSRCLGYIQTLLVRLPKVCSFFFFKNDFEWSIRVVTKIFFPPAQDSRLRFAQFIILLICLLLLQIQKFLNIYNSAWGDIYLWTYTNENYVTTKRYPRIEKVCWIEISFDTNTVFTII